MTSGSDLISAVAELTNPRTTVSEAFELRVDWNGSFLGRSPSGRLALVVPTKAGPQVPGRKAGALTLQFASQVLFDLRGTQWQSPAAVVECDDESVLQTFCALSADIAGKLRASDRLPTRKQVSDALFTWEALLRGTRRLSLDEELGLWGELWLITQQTGLDAAIRAWRGPERAVVDFVGGSVGLECKTSLAKLRHQVSHSQLDRPLGDLRVFLMSVHVAEDPVDGRTLAQLVDQIAPLVVDASSLETKLLFAGYARNDAAYYSRQLIVTEPPHWFPMESVPRVRNFDAGVSAIRYTVHLDANLAVDAEEAYPLHGARTFGVTA